MKHCPVHGCGGLIRAEALVCHSHWRLLPRDQRHELSRLNFQHWRSEAQQDANRQAIDDLNALGRQARLYA